jgi:hypothetical protein
MSLSCNFYNQIIMPFINEQPSEQDIVKYGLREQSEEFRLGNSKIEWTIDRARDIYLRFMKSDERELPTSLFLIFYWHGTRIDIQLESLHFDNKGREYAEETLRIYPTYRPNNSFWLPPNIEPMRTQIIADHYCPIKTQLNSRKVILAKA